MTVSRPGGLLVSVTLALGSIGPVAAQDGDGLGPPLLRAQEGFTHVFDVAEVDDHRVLLTDNLESVIAIVDLRTGAVERLGRHGSGPREYRSVFSILRFGHDTLAVYDARLRRFLPVVNGEVTDAWSFPRPPVRGHGVPRGPDADGAYWFTTRVLGPGGLERAERVYRWMPERDALETVDSIMAYGPDQARHGLIPMPRGDGWSLLADGRVARVVADEYRVEWTAPDGQHTAAPPIPYEPVPVGEAERLAYLRGLASAPSGTATARGTGSQEDRDDPELTRRRREYPPSVFPTHVPPFQRGWLPSSPGGEIWITRNGSAGADHTVIDVVDGNGRLAHRFRLPGNARVVGVSRTRVYIVHRDDVDLEWLTVYARPGGPGAG